MTIIEQINNENIKAEVPKFNVGDTVSYKQNLTVFIDYDLIHT